MKHLSWTRALTVPLGVALSVLCFAPQELEAKPLGSVEFCSVYADAPACTGGSVDCTTCHTVPPARNLYGAQVGLGYEAELMRPLTDEVFVNQLPDALSAIEGEDADGDGYSNLDELMAGSSPSDAADVPREQGGMCGESTTRPSGLNVCAYDPIYVFKKVKLDFCGVQPTYNELTEFEEDPSTDRLTEVLDECLASEFWVARDGQVWNLANMKIRPVQAIKSGPRDQGPIPLADYDDDYNFYVYTNTGDRDVREMLTGKYFVRRTESLGGPTVYEEYRATLAEEIQNRGYNAQAVAGAFRAGMLTHRWNLMFFTMFTAIPRTNAAQAYRSYLGYDISKLEGLFEPTGELVDYDNKGVLREDCAVCHNTLDPLTYPFASYEGIGGGDERGVSVLPFSYNPNRLRRFEPLDGPTVTDTPTGGAILGQPVANLLEWAEVAANSDEFAQKVVLDYWRTIIGEEPRPTELVEFEGLWRGLMDENVHNYRVEQMLHALIKTEAYGVP